MGELLLQCARLRERQSGVRPLELSRGAEKRAQHEREGQPQSRAHGSDRGVRISAREIGTEGCASHDDEEWLLSRSGGSSYGIYGIDAHGRSCAASAIN